MRNLKLTLDTPITASCSAPFAFSFSQRRSSEVRRAVHDEHQEELKSAKTEFIKEDSENMSDPEPCRMKHTEDTEEQRGDEETILDEETIRYFEPECLFSLVESINLIFFLNGSEFEIEEVQKESYSPLSALSETQVAWPVHQPPISFTYHSSGHSPMALPDLQPRPFKKRSNASRKRHKKTVAASPEPSFKLANEQPKPVFHEPAPVFHKPAPVFHEPPKEAEWLIDFWAEPAVPAFPEPTCTCTRGWGTHGWDSSPTMASHGS
ncbi:hypothetical protein DPX16_2867 [Anabarilius grahami]|uniref:Uncharacterized protein n=1 Tax=Anabarilius grahami TaxID=495550 RepID=A0A3N0Z9Z1_ANAGA|nr:hypothetical protein DPX16_2867 [Anabarilius grahami]